MPTTPAGLIGTVPTTDIAPGGTSVLPRDDQTVRRGLERVAAHLRDQGVAVPALRGKLLRPMVAYALVPPQKRAMLDDRFWFGALAIQMVHEASLLHDDILDDAETRRGRPTLCTEHGIAAALVRGDQYLTASYRAAALTRWPAFLDVFIRSVERTVAGEVEQGRAAGVVLDRAAYEQIILGKSGELFGAAASLGGLGDGAEADARSRLGQRLGALYQRVDDLLDYCQAAETGKPPFQDYRQGKWTWVLGLAGVESFAWTSEAVARAVFGAVSGSSPARAAVEELERTRYSLLGAAQELAPEDVILSDVLDDWIRAAREGIARQEACLARDGAVARNGGAPAGGGPVRNGAAARDGSAPRDADPARESAAPGMPVRTDPVREVAELARDLGGPDDWAAYFAQHARTFRFAARLFPKAEGARVASLYAFCRFSDDLVDNPHDGAPADVLTERLSAWRTLARAAFDGVKTDIPLLDHVMAQARDRGVDWLYPDAVLEGVGMDLVPWAYRDWDDLEAYTFGVAGAVGGWMSQLFAVHDPEMLEQAHALGHAMQLTNIVRDVGEDWRMGRCYLPQELLSSHGITVGDLAALVSGAVPVTPAWQAVMEDVMDRADAWYDLAWPGIRGLPSSFRRPVAVAAAAYQGIHDEVRRNRWNNLNRRAVTSRSRKAVLGLGGLRRAARP